jgi:hypothetical protein
LVVFVAPSERGSGSVPAGISAIMRPELMRQHIA